MAETIGYALRILEVQLRIQLTAAAVTPPAEHAARQPAGAADAAVADADVHNDMDKANDIFYEIAAQEVIGKAPVPSIWARAFSDAHGDRDAAVALYIRYRVERLAQDHKDQLAREKEEYKRKAREAAEIIPWHSTQRYAVCPNKDCGYVGAFDYYDEMRGPLVALLLLCGIVPGVIYSFVAGSGYACPKCNRKISLKEFNRLKDT